MINKIMVSVIAEWQRNLHHLKIRLLIIPAKRPIPTELIASRMKSPIILKGVEASNSSDWSPCTVLNRIILTISLKTPSP